MFLLNSRSSLVTATRLSPNLALLLPKLRSYFAEFPRDTCIRYALGYSPKNTCVSSRYGLLYGFSRDLGLYFLLTVTVLQNLVASET